MKFKSICLMTIFSCLASGSLFAATPGVFIGANAGYGRLMTPTGYAFSASSTELARSIGGFGFNANGGYNFNQYLEPVPNVEKALKTEVFY